VRVQEARGIQEEVLEIGAMQNSSVAVLAFDQSNFARG